MGSRKPNHCFSSFSYEGMMEKIEFLVFNFNWCRLNYASIQWTDCIIDKIFKNIEIAKYSTMALKSILNLVKLQSLVAKCSKM